MTRKEIALNRAARKRFPRGSRAQVTDNQIAGQGSSFVGQSGPVVGYCYGDVILDLGSIELCFHQSEIRRI